MIRQILALAFIFVCTTIAWMILGATIFSRTYGSNQQLQGHVASTWGTAQEQAPPTATYTVTEPTTSTTVENGRLVVHNDKVQRQIPLALEASRVRVNVHLDPRQKRLLWYSTYAVDFAGDYTFRNASAQDEMVDFRLKFPAQKALYDNLQMKINDQSAAFAINDQGAVGQATVPAGATAVLHVAYASQGLDTWKYQLATTSRKLVIFRSSCRPTFATSTSLTIPFLRLRSSWFPEDGSSPGNIQTWFPDFRSA